MDFLPFWLQRHSPPEEIKISNLRAIIGEAIDTPLGTMTGVKIELTKNLPNIALFPKQKAELYTTNSYQIDSSQKLHLEGNFDQYFEVYSIPGYETFALEILTPEFMNILIESEGSFIILIALNYVFVLMQTPQSITPQIHDSLIRAADALVENLNLKMLTWSDSDSLQSSRKMLNYKSYDTVRLKGRQLDYGVYVGLVFAAILLFFIWVTFLGSPSFQKKQDLPGDLLFSVGVIVGFPIAVFLIKRNQK